MIQCEILAQMLRLQKINAYILISITFIRKKVKIQFCSNLDDICLTAGYDILLNQFHVEYLSQI